jgi:hypothetical protein
MLGLVHIRTARGRSLMMRKFLIAYSAINVNGGTSYGNTFGTINTGKLTQETIESWQKHIVDFKAYPAFQSVMITNIVELEG